MLMYNWILFWRGSGRQFDESEAADWLHRGRGAADILWHLRRRFSVAPAQDTHRPQRPQGDTLGH